MRTHRGIFAVAVVLGTLIGCNNKATTKPESSADERTLKREKSADMAAAVDPWMVEEYDAASIAWSVRATGELRAEVRDEKGAPVEDKLAGSLSVRGDDGEMKTIPLTASGQAGVLMAQGPALKSDITEIQYNITRSDKPLTGSIHVPITGTASMDVDAKLAASVKLPEAPAPHGGIIQVVGNDRLEIVSAESSDEVRVYLLDAELHPQPITVGMRVTLAMVSDAPEVMVLTSSAGVYWTGKWKANVDPWRMTIAVRIGDTVRCAVVGRAPAGVLVAGPKARKLKVHVKAWSPEVDAKVVIQVKEERARRGKDKGHDDDDRGPRVVRAEGPEIKGKSGEAGFKGKAESPEGHVKVDVKEKKNGKEKVSVKIK